MNAYTTVRNIFIGWYRFISIDGFNTHPLWFRGTYHFPSSLHFPCSSVVYLSSTMHSRAFQMRPIESISLLKVALQGCRALKHCRLLRWQYQHGAQRVKVRSEEGGRSRLQAVLWGYRSWMKLFILAACIAGARTIVHHPLMTAIAIGPNAAASFTGPWVGWGPFSSLGLSYWEVTKLEDPVGSRIWQ